MPVTDTFFKKYLSIYLFFGCTGSLLLRRLSLVSSCRRYSLISLHGFLIVVAALVAERRLYGMWASVAVAVRVSCSVACGLFLDQGSNLCPLPWQVDS